MQATIPKPPPPVTKCIKCGKPPKPGSCFCTQKCKRAWQSGIDAWRRSISGPPIEGAPTLF